MRPLSLYISFLFFIACLAAPSVAVLSNLIIKETKVAKLFDIQEEDDTCDDESEKEKKFDIYFAPFVVPELIVALIIYHHFYLIDLPESAQELLTPPPRS